MPYTLLSKEIIEDFERSRTSSLVSTGLSPNGLLNLDDAQLLQLQRQLLMGEAWGSWEFPPTWGPPNWKWPSQRSYRLELALPEGVDPESVYARRIWRELLRFSLALRLWPGRSGVLSKPSSIVSTLSDVGRIIKGLGGSDQRGFWSRINRVNALEFAGKVGPTRVNTLIYYFGIGALPDCPSVTRRSGQQPRRDRTGEPEHSAPPDSATQWMPFPDSYIIAAGWRAVYTLREIGPTLTSALESANELPIRTLAADGKILDKKAIREANKARRDEVIAGWDWRASDGSPLRSMPMPIYIKDEGKKSCTLAWPPVTYSGALKFLLLVQASHLWVVALSLAGRHGEVVDMKTNCIRREVTTTPTASFVTWKLEDVLGRLTEAPLPDVVAFAIRSQIRVAAVIKKIHGQVDDCLWVTGFGRRIGAGGVQKLDLNGPLKTFNTAFQLNPLLDNTDLHMHRFRKTLVRIVALALVHAPKILMDLLGHRDEQMTVMRYVLSDPGILAEIEEITREMVVLKGVEAVAVRERLEGKAAPVFRARVQRYARLLGKNAFEPSNLREFVEAITENGTDWAIIGPGKVCTGFRRGGLCNEGSGEANPHYCTPECHNHLTFPEYEKTDGTTASTIADSIETLDYMVEKLRTSVSDGEDMMAALFVGQVIGILNHWSQVDRYFREHHMADPEIRKLFPKVQLLP